MYGGDERTNWDEAAELAAQANNNNTTGTTGDSTRAALRTPHPFDPDAGARYTSRTHAARHLERDASRARSNGYVSLKIQYKAANCILSLNKVLGWPPPLDALRVGAVTVPGFGGDEGTG